MMKKQYDFSKAVKGKYCMPLEQLDIPIYLNSKVKKYYVSLSQNKELNLNMIVNAVLKRK